MTRISPFAASIATILALLVSSTTFAAGNNAAAKSDATTAAKAKRELSPELTALRDRVRQALAAHQKATFNTQQNSATEIMAVCLAFGCDSEVALDAQNAQRINGITCLCWNYPCAGGELLTGSHRHIAARVGYGFQERPGELLAALALSRVQASYPMRVGKAVRTVADLVAAEKLLCRSGGDLSLKLIGLSYYADEPQWKNSLGETWSVSRMVEEEIAKPIAAAPEIGVSRLMGLSYAVARQEKRGATMNATFKQARKYTSDYQAFALQIQNSDGSWGPSFLAARSVGADAASQLQATGRVLEWLAMSLPVERLDDAQVVNAVDRVTQLLGEQRYQWNAPMLSTREIVSLGHALHALSVYDARVFAPADAQEKPAADQKPAAAG